MIYDTVWSRIYDFVENYGNLKYIIKCTNLFCTPATSS